MVYELKHILVVSQYFYPEQFRINDICLELVKRGYRVTVVTGVPNYPKGVFYEGYNWFSKRREVYKGIDVVRLPIVSRGTGRIRLILNYLSFVLSGFVWSRFTRIKADSVYAHQLSPISQALVGVWYAKRHGLSCILDVQDLWPDSVQSITGLSNGFILRLIDSMTQYIYRNCERILVTSRAYASKLETRGVPKSKLHYWPQYAEDYYRPSTTKSSLIPSDGVMNIAFTGNIGIAQGLDVLPKAAQILKNQGVFVRFIIVGDGRFKDTLFRKIEELQVATYFHVLPQQPATNIPSILAASSVALISFSDAPLFQLVLPAKLQSYMACGMPILAHAAGEVKHVIEEADCGMCCQGATELAACIVDFMRFSTEQMRRFGENALAYYVLHYDKAALFSQLEGHLFPLSDKGLISFAHITD